MLILFSPLQVKNKPHDQVEIVCLFLNWVRSCTVMKKAENNQNHICIPFRSLDPSPHPEIHEQSAVLNSTAPSWIHLFIPSDSINYSNSLLNINFDSYLVSIICRYFLEHVPPSPQRPLPGRDMNNCKKRGKSKN
jgi:hypothetical protein